MSISISRGAQHALRALVHLAGAPADRFVPVHEIAERESVPAAVLSKVARQREVRGVIEAQRGASGASGGIRLERAAESISLLEPHGLPAGSGGVLRRGTSKSARPASRWQTRTRSLPRCCSCRTSAAEVDADEL